MGKNTQKKLPSPPEAQNAGSDYIQGSAESCWSQFASSSVIPYPSGRHTDMQTDRYIMLCLCVCVRVGSRLRSHRRPASHVPLPSSLPRSLCPLSLLPSPSSPPQKQQLRSTLTPSSPAASSPQLFFLPRRPAM